MKKTLIPFLIFVVFCFSQLRGDILYDGELRIDVTNLPAHTTITFQISLTSSTHWDFYNNIATNTYLGETQYAVNSGNTTISTTVYCYWRDNPSGRGMGKGLYNVYAKDSNGNVLAYFTYDTRTSKTYRGSPDLVVSYNCSVNYFYHGSLNITSSTITIWDYVDILGPNQETDKFEPQAPSGLFVYNSGGHPQLVWSNNYLEDYWTAIEVYRAETYSDPPSNWNSIATLSANSTSYYDTRYTVGQGAIAWYKVCKRNVNKLSQFSNTVSINIIPQAIVNNNYEQKNISNSENSVNEDALYQNYPNPFNPTTIITFSLHEADHVTIKLYDILGKEVKEIADESYSKGIHQITLDASSLAAGLYVYTLSSNKFTAQRKLIVLK